MGKTFKPMLQVVRFGAEDVIATSGAPTSLYMSNWGDGKIGNLKISYGDIDYSDGDDLVKEIINNRQTPTILISYGQDELLGLFLRDSVEDEFGGLSPEDNGEYSWISANSRWEKKQ